MIQRILPVFLAAALLAACAGIGASGPAPTASAGSSASSPAASSAATRTPRPASTSRAEPTGALATEQPAATPELAQPTAQPLATVDGQVVLQLGAGNGEGQVGVRKEDTIISGPRSFRIGADGSIRVLDNLNKRVLFFQQSGKLARTFSIGQAQDPADFIVNNAGEVFVFDRAGNQVLRYSPQGQVTATFPLSPGVSASADGIMLTAAQDLMLVQNNQSFWVLAHQGVIVPPELQPLTARAGTVTPRSPVVFQTTLTDQQTPFLHIIGLRSGGANDLVADVDGRAIELPSDAQFFNVDRAMNLYYMRPSSGNDAFDVWRVTPDGAAAGGAHIITGACGTSWRSLYVDQAGTAWTMCVGENGATITRYSLLAADGAPLPEPARDAADVTWRPGARLDAA